MRHHFCVAFALLLTSTTCAAQVYRCGNTYTHVPCAGGKTIDTSPPMSDPDGPSTTLVYLCRAPRNSLYWTAETCASRGWTLERTERVPRNVPWQEQVRFARAQHQRAQQSAVPPPAIPADTTRSPGANDREAVCTALDERVRALDSMGRAGSQYYDLDRVRRERKSARDQQFRLRCR